MTPLKTPACGRLLLNEGGYLETPHRMSVSHGLLSNKQATVVFIFYKGAALTLGGYSGVKVKEMIERGQKSKPTRCSLWVLAMYYLDK